MINADTVNVYLAENGKPKNKGYLTKWNEERGEHIARWDHDDLPAPTPAQLQEIAQRIEADKYKQRRAAELGPLDGDGMDAIRREIAALRAGEPETAEYKAYREEVADIKARHPKPQE